MERRNFLKLMGGAVGGLAFGAAFSPMGGQPTAVQEVARTTVRRHRMRMPRVRSTFARGALTKFVDPLPVPPVLLPSSINIVDGTFLYEVRMTQVRQKLHRDLPPTTVWGYNG